MKTITFLLAGMMAACLTACTEYDGIAENNGNTDNKNGLIIEVTDEFTQAATRADYSGFPATTFEEGDAIGLYAFNTVTNSYAASNVKFTRQADGSWTTTGEIFYRSRYVYYAYFPWRSTAYSPSASGTVDDVDTKFAPFISDASNYFWKADQSSKANFTYSNLMIAKGVESDANTIHFTMNHKRGMVIIGDGSNNWYYTDDAGTLHATAFVSLSGNIPYTESDIQYFLVKPDVATPVAGQSVSIAAGKYRLIDAELAGTPTYQYAVSTNQGSSWGGFSSSRPAWLTLDTETADDKTVFQVTTARSSSETIALGKADPVRDIPADEVLKARTPVTDIDLSTRNNDGTARTLRTTANCYLVHAPGLYRLPLVYGNAIKNGAVNESAYHRGRNHENQNITGPWIKDHGISVDGAQLIWQDSEGLISSVGIDGDYLTFSVDADKIAEGNALIAATAGGTVVWSWHIWVTTETLNDLFAWDGYDFAPVNLGQVSGSYRVDANIYAGDLCKVRATANGVTVEFQVTAKNDIAGGTYYCNYSPFFQWGRKDPFIPSCGAYNAAGTKITESDMGKISSPTVGQTIQNPHKYSIGTHKPYNDSYIDYWDANNEFSNQGGHAVKTVYDPCPPDFCIPGFDFDKNSVSSWMTDPPGIYITINDNSTFIPASGMRVNEGSSSSYYNGTTGCFWTKDIYVYPNNSNSWHFITTPTETKIDYTYRSDQMPVRPVAEINN